MPQLWERAVRCPNLGSFPVFYKDGEHLESTWRLHIASHPSTYAAATRGKQMASSRWDTSYTNHAGQDDREAESKEPRPGCV
ncbi:Putative protein of unknown function [Podospora comata]|uniref:Uncharacterized protein n=1 Tax=Podospora comata TaxID=48703 RepID=A0ABY6RUB2_PODCO|nr:Putative protein of unknown function [Podospora comata]